MIEYNNDSKFLKEKSQIWKKNKNSIRMCMDY